MKKQKGKRKPPDHVAVHEAAHAVIDVLLGVPFEYVSLKEVRDEVKVDGVPYTRIYTLGTKWSEENTKEWNADWERGILPEAQLLSFVAGGIAEAMMGINRRQVQMAMGDDLLPVGRVFKDEKKVREVVAGAIDKVAPLIAEHWTEINRVANLLLSRETLTLAEVKEILER